MNVKTLIIEDQENVAFAIEQQLLQLGNFHVAHSRSVVQALDRISAAQHAPYDLILCDYNLGECTNGQQLLEFLRSEQRIPRQTIFIMLTAEASYSGVASAVELAPDAYLLKPFTMDSLAQRINSAMAKRQLLKPIYALIEADEPDLSEAIKDCNAIILSANRFALDALKLKAECLIKLEQWGDAATVYDRIIAWRPTPWAEVGRARTLRLMGHPDLAKEKLLATLKTFPKFVAVYDELAALAEEHGDSVLAQTFLEKAHAIVPSNRRTRGIGLLALRNADLDKASRFLKIVTERDRYGLKRSTEDFFGLSAALRRLDRHDEAMAVLDTLKLHFPETRPLQVRKMAAEATILAVAKRPFDAKKRVLEAYELHHDQMEPRTQIELGEACHYCGDTEKAEQLFLHVAENWQEDGEVVARVKETMLRIGLDEDALTALDKSMRELIGINNRVVKNLDEGLYDEAVDDMAMVAKRLRNHATVQANYVHALLLWLEHTAPKDLMTLPFHTKPRQNVALAREHLRQLARISPKHPRLALLLRLFAKLTGETCAIRGLEGDADGEGAASMESGPA